MKFLNREKEKNVTLFPRLYSVDFVVIGGFFWSAIIIDLIVSHKMENGMKVLFIVLGGFFLFTAWRTHKEKGEFRYINTWGFSRNGLISCLSITLLLTVSYFQTIDLAQEKWLVLWLDDYFFVKITRILTYSFYHISERHLIGNIFTVIGAWFILGKYVREHEKWFLLLFGSVFAGCIEAISVAEDSGIAGCSAGISALVAMVFIRALYTLGFVNSMSCVFSILALVLSSFLVNGSAGYEIAHGTHLSGLLFGTGYEFAIRYLPRIRNIMQQDAISKYFALLLWNTIGIACIIYNALLMISITNADK